MPEISVVVRKIFQNEDTITVSEDQLERILEGKEDISSIIGEDVMDRLLHEAGSIGDVLYDTQVKDENDGVLDDWNY